MIRNTAWINSPSLVILSNLNITAFCSDIIIANKKAVRAMNRLNHGVQEGGGGFLRSGEPKKETRRSYFYPAHNLGP